MQTENMRLQSTASILRQSSASSRIHQRLSTYPGAVPGLHKPSGFEELCIRMLHNFYTDKYYPNPFPYGILVSGLHAVVARRGWHLDYEQRPKFSVAVILPRLLFLLYESAPSCILPRTFLFKRCQSRLANHLRSAQPSKMDAFLAPNVMQHRDGVETAVLSGIFACHHS